MARGLGEATVSELESGLSGSVVRPDDPAYDEARRIWNYAIDRHPALVIQAANTDDVVRAVRFAVSEGLPIAVRGGGHSVAGFSTCDDGVVIDLSAMNQVDVDVAGQRATAGGGTTWSDFDAVTQQHGLATTGGVISSTGLGGFTLGGGIGFLVRKYGLTCDNLISAEVVTADGSVIQTSDTDNPELFWALRGGGGNFGVVTRLELALHQVGPVVLGGPIFFPGEEAVDMLKGWRNVAESAPDELTLIAVMTTAPPAPFIPEEWHFRKICAVAACWAGDPAEGEDAVKPLRALGTPVADLLGPIPYVELQSMLDAMWGRGAANYFTSTFIDTFSDEGIDTLSDWHRRSPDLPVQAELHVHHLGGAMGRVGEGDTAFTDRTSPYIVNCIARTPDPADLTPHAKWARNARDAMSAYGSGKLYVNFTGEGGADKVAAAYPPDIYKRLQSVKDSVDPTNVFRFNQNIPPSK